MVEWRFSIKLAWSGNHRLPASYNYSHCRANYTATHSSLVFVASPLRAKTATSIRRSKLRNHRVSTAQCKLSGCPDYGNNRSVSAPKIPPTTDMTSRIFANSFTAWSHTTDSSHNQFHHHTSLWSLILHRVNQFLILDGIQFDDDASRHSIACIFCFFLHQHDQLISHVVGWRDQVNVRDGMRMTGDDIKKLRNVVPISFVGT